MSNLKVAILSDSHRKTQLTSDAISHLKEQGASYIIHAGDLEVKENLDIIKNSSLPYICVFGNNDRGLVNFQNEYNIYQEPYYFKIEDVSFKLMHLPFYQTPDSDIVISGHTHIFNHSFVNGTLFLNPGEICAREQDKTQYVLLEISKTQYIINYFYRKPTQKQWQKEIITYKK